MDCATLERRPADPSRVPARGDAPRVSDELRSALLVAATWYSSVLQPVDERIFGFAQARRASRRWRRRPAAARRGRLMTLRTSAVAVWYSSDSLSSRGPRLHLLEKPHVLDCDHGLVGEGLESPICRSENDPASSEPLRSPRWANRPSAWDRYDAAIVHNARNITVLVIRIHVDIRDLLHVGADDRASRRQCHGRAAGDTYARMASPASSGSHVRQQSG